MIHSMIVEAAWNLAKASWGWDRLGKRLVKAILLVLAMAIALAGKGSSLNQESPQGSAIATI